MVDIWGEAPTKLFLHPIFKHYISLSSSITFLKRKKHMDLAPKGANE